MTAHRPSADDGLDLGAPRTRPERTDMAPPVPVAEVAPATPALPPQLLPPSDAVIPQRGRAKRKYLRYKRKNTPDPKNPQFLRVPPLGKREQAALDIALETQRVAREAAYQEQQRRAAEHDLLVWHDELNAYQYELEQRLFWMSGLGIAPIASFCNIKSGTKSMNAIGVGNVIAQVTRRTVVVMPTTANTATATAARMSGLEGRTLTVSEYIFGLKSFGTPREFGRRVLKTKFGLMVLAEDVGSSANEDDDKKTAEFMQGIDVMIPNVDALLLDLGNDNISKWSIATMAARLSHVLFFPFSVLESESISEDTVRATIAGYNTDDGVPDDVNEQLFAPFEHKSDTGWHVPTIQKVRDSIVLATKTQPGQKVEFTKITTPTDQGVHAKGLPPWQGSGINVPFDNSVGRRGSDGRLQPFDLDALDQLTHIAYLEAAVAMYQTAAPIQGIDLTTYDKYTALQFPNPITNPPV